MPLIAYHQLRAPVGDFVGRIAERDELRATLLPAAQTGSTTLAGVQGMGGAGKTELAYAVAHDLQETFPDAQIVVSLRGASTHPISPEQALQAVIRAFMPDASLPDDLSALEVLYRAQLHGKRVLILADDARDAAQVRPLLPPPGCALLITSRSRFSLPAMTTVALDPLPTDAAVALLCAICPRLTADEAALLAQACGSLPLALRIGGGILHNDPTLPVADYLARLADDHHRLAQLRDPDDPQLDVAATLALSYDQLDPLAQAVFRQLGVFVTDFSTDLALSVVVAEEHTTDVLRTLLRRNLVQYEAAHARWRLHDLVRDIARQRLEAAGEADAAWWRYTRAVVALAQDIQDQYLAGDTMVALARFDVERAHLDAPRQWAYLHTGTPEGDELLLNSALATRHIQLLRDARRHAILPLWERVRAAAQRLGDRFNEGRALNYLGIVYMDLGEPQTAISYHEQHLAITRETGYRQGEGSALGNLGLSYYHLGNLERAIDYHQRRLAIAREVGDRRGESNALHNLGIAYHDVGNLSEAIGYYEQTLAITRETGDRLSEARTLSNLGNGYTDQGQVQRAIEVCQVALSSARALGDQGLEGLALGYLARAQLIQGDCSGADTAFQQAVTCFQEVGDRWGKAECQWLFGLALAERGERERALSLLRAAVAYEQEIGHAKTAEHTALLAQLEARGLLSREL
jgi:tetratricopeptide (TPR) repeat protein